MNEAALRARSLSIPLVLGAYAALLAVLPDTTTRLTLLVPIALISVAWWVLIGPPDRWLVAFLCAAAILPPLPVALGNSGPHLSLVLASLGLAAGVIRLGRWRVPTTPLARSMMALFFTLLFSVVFAGLYSGIPVALGSLARVLLFGISVYVFFYVTSGPGDAAGGFRTARILFIAGAASALFACVDFYFQFPAPAGFGPQYVWLDSGVHRRAQGLFYEASALGNFCAFFLVMIAVALTRPREQSPVSRRLLLAGAATFSAALMLSFSRSSLLNVLAALATLLWLNRTHLRFRRIGVGFLVAVAAGSLMTYYLLPAYTELYWSRLSGSATYLFSSTEGVLSGRLASWSAVVRFLRENPPYALLGIGYKTLPYSSFIGQPVIGDNMYVTMLVETGVIGLAAFFSLNLSILKAAYRAAGNADPRASFFGAWIFCFWIGQMVQMLSQDLFTYWRAMPFYFWALAVAVRTADEHPLPRPVQ